MMKYALLSILAAIAAAGCASGPIPQSYPWVRSAVPRSSSPEMKPPLAQFEPPRPAATASGNRPAAPTAGNAAQLDSARDIHIETMLGSMLAAYKSFEYGEAIGRAEAVLRDPQAGGGDKAEAALLAGAAAYLLDDEPRARAYFRSALKHEAGARPNPAMFPKAILDCFDHVKDEEVGFRAQGVSSREE